MNSVIITPQKANPDFLVTITQADNGVSINAPMPDSFAMDFASSYDAPFAQALGANIPGAKYAKLGGYTLQSQVMTAQVWQGSSQTDLNVAIEFQAELDPIAEVHDPIMQLCKLVSPSVNGTGLLLTAPGPRLDWTKIPESTKQAATDSINAITSIGATSDNTTAGQATDSSSAVNTPSTQPNSQSSQQSASDKKAANIALQALKSAVKNQISITIGNYLHFDSVVITNVQLTFSSILDDATGLPVHAKADIKFTPLFMITADDLDNIFLTKRLSGVQRDPNYKG